MNGPNTLYSILSQFAMRCGVNEIGGPFCANGHREIGTRPYSRQIASRLSLCQSATVIPSATKDFTAISLCRADFGGPERTWFFGHWMNAKSQVAFLGDWQARPFAAYQVRGLSLPPRSPAG